MNKQYMSVLFILTFSFLMNAQTPASTVGEKSKLRPGRAVIETGNVQELSRAALKRVAEYYLAYDPYGSSGLGPFDVEITDANTRIKRKMQVNIRRFDNPDHSLSSWAGERQYDFDCAHSLSQREIVRTTITEGPTLLDDGSYSIAGEVVTSSSYMGDSYDTTSKIRLRFGVTGFNGFAID